MKKVIPIFILFTTLLLVGMISYLYLHEAAHIQIFKSYGSEVSYELGLKEFTVYGTCPTDTSCIQEQNLNEVVGYSANAIIINLWLIALFFLIFMIFWSKK